MGSVKSRTLTATIANGASLSGAVDLGNAVLCAIRMPAAWTAAGLTFQGSHDGATFQNIYDAAGEMAIGSSVADASRDLAVSPAAFYGFRFLKVRSGTAASAVNQGAARDIVLTVRDFA